MDCFSHPSSLPIERERSNPGWGTAGTGGTAAGAVRSWVDAVRDGRRTLAAVIASGTAVIIIQ
jgi:hypothetical protein